MNAMMVPEHGGLLSSGGIVEHWKGYGCPFSIITTYTTYTGVQGRTNTIKALEPILHRVYLFMIVIKVKVGN